MQNGEAGRRGGPLGEQLAEQLLAGGLEMWSSGSGHSKVALPWLGPIGVSSGVSRNDWSSGHDYKYAGGRSSRVLTSGAAPWSLPRNLPSLVTGASVFSGSVCQWHPLHGHLPPRHNISSMSLALTAISSCPPPIRRRSGCSSPFVAAPGCLLSPVVSLALLEAECLGAGWSQCTGYAWSPG